MPVCVTFKNMPENNETEVVQFYELESSFWNKFLLFLYAELAWRMNRTFVVFVIFECFYHKMPYIQNLNLQNER